nr:MAG TPA_asm: hypothetical protein [Caudoviricetes sp.]
MLIAPTMSFTALGSYLAVNLKVGSFFRTPN